MRKSINILFLLFLVIACKKESFQEESDFGYAYQPKQIGYWVEYEVDSLYFNDITSPVTIDTSRFYIREVLESTFLDASGEENIRVELYKKQNFNDAWQIYQVGSVKYTNSAYERYFNDIRLVNLTFPVKTGKEWNGNAYVNVQNESTLEYLDDTKYDWSYEYTLVDLPENVGAFNFDSCATIIQIDDENLFEKKYSKEVYAKNIGMVRKEMIFLNTQSPPTGQTFIERAETGFILEYTLIDYKN